MSDWRRLYRKNTIIWKKEKEYVIKINEYYGKYILRIYTVRSNSIEIHKCIETLTFPYKIDAIRFAKLFIKNNM